MTQEGYAIASQKSITFFKWSPPTFPIVHSDILSGIFDGILASILALILAFYSDILSGIQSGIYSDSLVFLLAEEEDTAMEAMAHWQTLWHEE